MIWKDTLPKKVYRWQTTPRRLFTLLVNREMQIKTQYQINTYLLEWLKLKTLTTSNVDEDIEQLELLYY